MRSLQDKVLLEKHFISMGRGRHYLSCCVPPELDGSAHYLGHSLSPTQSQAGGSVQVLNQAVQLVIKPLLCLHVS